MDNKEYSKRLILIYRQLKQARFYNFQESKQTDGLDSVRIGISGPTFKDVEDSIKWVYGQ